MASLEATRALWIPFASLLTQNADAMIDSDFVDLVVVAQVVEQTNQLLSPGCDAALNTIFKYQY